jgi:pimeloyl-ACP methyl ester carboxylesterase
MALRTFLDGALFAERLEGPADGRPLLVVLHGWRRDRHDLAPVVAGREAILFDLPGHGASPPPPGPWGSADYAAQVASALDSLAPQRPVTVVCHSFGGRVGVHLAAARPDLVGGLVLCGVPLLRLTPAYRPSLGYRLVRWAHRRKLVPESVMERLRRRKGSADYQAASGVMRDVFVKLVNETYEAQLRALTCPVAFVWGQQDTAAPVAVAEAATSMVARVASYEVVDTGHDVHRTHLEAFTRAIAAVEAAQ